MSKVGIITGASGGIGRALAIELSKIDYQLLLLGRNESRLKLTADLCKTKGVKINCLAGDLLDSCHLDKVAKEINEKYEKVDVLINNAGIAIRNPIHQISTEDWKKVLDTNVSVAVYLTKIVLKKMIKKKEGAIINISSLSGRFCSADNALYSASKHALNGLTGSVFEDVREFGIKVTSIMPGFVATELTSKIGRDSEKMINPSDVAETVKFILSTSKNCCPTEIVLRPQFQP